MIIMIYCDILLFIIYLYNYFTFNIYNFLYFIIIILIYHDLYFIIIILIYHDLYFKKLFYKIEFKSGIKLNDKYQVTILYSSTLYIV